MRLLGVWTIERVLWGSDTEPDAVKHAQGVWPLSEDVWQKLAQNDGSALLGTDRERSDERVSRRVLDADDLKMARPTPARETYPTPAVLRLAPAVVRLAFNHLNSRLLTRA